MISRPTLPLFCFLLALYLLTYAPTLHSSDGLAMFSTAESLVRRGAWDIEQIHWMGLQQGTFGLDGLLYSRKGLGQPILALPLTWLGLLIPGFGPVSTTMLFGSLLTALTGVFILWVYEALGYNTRSGLIAALIFGTATLAWPYAKTFFSDPLAGFLLLAALLALLKFKQGGLVNKRRRPGGLGGSSPHFHSPVSSRQGLSYAFVAGLCLGWAVATRYAEALFLPLFGLLLLAYLRGENRSVWWRSLIAFGLPILAVGVGLMAFNLTRYGDPLDTGYLAEETFSAIWWQGITGQLISPGRGLLLYSPILLLSFFGLKGCWQRHRAETWVCLGVIGLHLLLYGKWFMWHGGCAWGPRFMVPTLPFWVILMAPVLAPPITRSARWIGVLGLWGVSVLVQIPGVAVDFDWWQNALLETGLPLFAPVTFFAWAYSPLLQTWQFISLPKLDVAWVVEGVVVWWLVGLLAGNFLLALATLWQFRQPSLSMARPRWLPWLALSVTLLSLTLLLRQAHQSQPRPLIDALATVNRYEASLIYQQPENAIPIAELYRGRRGVLGMAGLEENRLTEFTADETAVWWLAAHSDGVEDYLLAHYGLARNETIDPQQLILFARPDGPEQGLDVPFGEEFVLQSARLSTGLAAQSPLAVSLVWESVQPTDIDYSIFIHLRNEAGETVAQTDGQPRHWTRPTTTWQPGETLTDPHALWLSDLSPGTYTLITGLYHPATGERLLTAAGDHFVSLGEFRVGR